VSLCKLFNVKVTPLFGITLSWMTSDYSSKENSYFIDEQKFGPYSFGTTSISLKQHLLELK
jgi:hypothetical protein